jgi:hypothetical protein
MNLKGLTDFVMGVRNIGGVMCGKAYALLKGCVLWLTKWQKQRQVCFAA